MCLTNGNSVNGISVAVVVAVVVVLATVATGNNKNAAKTPPAGYHTMLQRCLERDRGKAQHLNRAVRNVHHCSGGLMGSYFHTQSTMTKRMKIFTAL